MVECGEQPGFAFETRQPIGVQCKARGEHFDCDVAAQASIACAITSPIPPPPIRPTIS
jgi:hypothetical protein